MQETRPGQSFCRPSSSASFLSSRLVTAEHQTRQTATVPPPSLPQHSVTRAIRLLPPPALSQGLTPPTFSFACQCFPSGSLFVRPERPESKKTSYGHMSCWLPEVEPTKWLRDLPANLTEVINCIAQRLCTHFNVFTVLLKQSGDVSVFGSSRCVREKLEKSEKSQ